jgi:hypothetical protein
MLSNPPVPIRLLLCCASFSLAAAGQQITIHFDYSNAAATLRVIETAPPLDAAIAELVKVPDTAEVLEKAKHHDSGVTLESLARTLASARLSQQMNSDPFQWRFCIRRGPEMRTLIDHLQSQEADITRRLLAALRRHLAPEFKLDATVHFVIGGVSSGWATGDRDFFVGMQFYHGDLEGVVMTMQHELFHAAQYAGYRGQDTDLAKLTPRQQVIYRLLDSLYREGSASYVEDLMSFPADRPYIKEMRQPALNNQARMKDNFVLLDTLIYRAARDPNFGFDDLYPIGFDWAWQNPLYSVGEYIGRALAKEKGNLREYLTSNPIRYLDDYIKLCGTTPSEKCQYTVGAQTAEAVQEIDRVLTAKP